MKEIKNKVVAISDIDVNGLQPDAHVLDFLTRLFPKGSVRLAATIAGRK